MIHKNKKDVFWHKIAIEVQEIPLWLKDLAHTALIPLKLIIHRLFTWIPHLSWELTQRLHLSKSVPSWTLVNHCVAMMIKLRLWVRWISFSIYIFLIMSNDNNHSQNLTTSCLFNSIIANNFRSIDSVFGEDCSICAVNLKRMWCDYTCHP